MNPQFQCHQQRRLASYYYDATNLGFYANRRFEMPPQVSLKRVLVRRSPRQISVTIRIYFCAVRTRSKYTM
jgi:hypothetical protein